MIIELGAAHSTPSMKTGGRGPAACLRSIYRLRASRRDLHGFHQRAPRAWPSTVEAAIDDGVF